MFRRILKVIEQSISWIVLAVVTLFLAEELVRVLWYVAGQWGFVSLFTDGAALHKVGELMILVPFFVFVHFNGLWETARLEKYVRKVRWVIWAGGVLVLVATFDLFGRVDWVWWTIPLVLFALLFPPIMKRWARLKAKWSGRILAIPVMALFLVHYGISYISSGYFVAPLPAPHPMPADTEAGRWRQDLHYLATELPRLHLNAFHSVDRQRFEQEVARIDSAIPNLTTAQIETDLRKLVAMIGDGHTAYDWTGKAKVEQLPLKLYWLSDGLFVTGADKQCHKALGSKVVEIGSTDVQTAFDEVCELIPHESDGWWLQQSAKLMTNADILFALGIVNRTDSVPFVFVTDDSDTLVCYLSPGGGTDLETLPKTLPLCRTKSDEHYWSDYFKAEHTLYLKYNVFWDPVSFPLFSDEFWQTVDDSAVGYVIVDFRDNGGGNSACFDSFYESILSHPNINRSGHLYVLVNRGSFSSTSLYSAILGQETNALFAGETMGGGTNVYGEVRTFRLPNSGVRVSYCVKYFQPWPDSLPPFKIDIPIMPTSQEYFAGRDPVLDSVLQLIRADLDEQ